MINKRKSDRILSRSKRMKIPVFLTCCCLSSPQGRVIVLFDADTEILLKKITFSSVINARLTRIVHGYLVWLLRHTGITRITALHVCVCVLITVSCGRSVRVFRCHAAGIEACLGVSSASEQHMIGRENRQGRT